MWISVSHHVKLIYAVSLNQDVVHIELYLSAAGGKQELYVCVNGRQSSTYWHSEWFISSRTDPTVTSVYLHLILSFICSQCLYISIPSPRLFQAPDSLILLHVSKPLSVSPFGLLFSVHSGICSVSLWILTGHTSQRSFLKFHLFYFYFSFLFQSVLEGENFPAISPGNFMSANLF